MLFPTLSRFAARHDLDGLRRASGNGVRMIALFLIPAAVGTAVLAEPLTRLVYQRGEFGAASTDAVTEALFWFSFSMPFSGANLLLTRTFFSLQRPWVPTALAGVTLLDQRRRVAPRSTSRSGSPGVVIGTAVASAAMTLGQAYRLRLELHGFEIGRTLRGVALMLAASAVLGVVAYFGWEALDSVLGESLLAQFVSVSSRSRWRASSTSPRCSRCASRRRARSPGSSSAGWGGAPRNLSWPHGGPGPHPELLDHRPYRPWEVDAGRPHPRDDPHGRPALDARAAARLDGPRARARDHDQGPGGARLLHESKDGETYQLQLIDTPGHVDFTYEVSRSLAACEGALLVVDASQGVEAQTVANTYLAVDSGLELIPCLNKIDLPGAEPERVAEEIADLIGEQPDEVLRISAKTGDGVAEVLEELIARVPPPDGDPEAPPRALIFDSEYDQYRGVIAYIRVVDGTFTKGEAIRAMVAGTQADIDDIGFFTPAHDAGRRRCPPARSAT